jgi:hypothetical protein
VFWSTLGRMIVVPIAFAVSAAAALFVLVTLGLERITQALHLPGSEGMDSAAGLFDFLRQAHLLASGLTVLPALAVILIGEVARIRSALYYVVGGGAALAAIPLLAHIGPTHASELPATGVWTGVWQVFATAGFAGGLVYWLLAGRRA